MAEGANERAAFNDHSIHPAIAVVEWRQIGLAKRLFINRHFPTSGVFRGEYDHGCEEGG